MMRKKIIFNKGFTVLELLVSMAIFAFMTAFVITKYGSFNQNILMTNLAYDVALTVRNAQSYGLNAKSAPTGTENYSLLFNYAYGVHFDTGVSGTPSPNTQIIFFVDVTPDGVYNAANDTLISKSTLKSGVTFSSLKAGSGNLPLSLTSVSPLDITFKRPNPNAIINGNGTSYPYVEITVQQAGSGLEKKVIVRSTGQISVSN